MEHVTLNVSGMSCMGCVNSVKNVLAPLPGVASVEVSLEKGEVVIGYDPAQANVEQFKSTIVDAGYDVL